MFPTMSVGLTLTMLIPQESVHVFKKGFLHQLTLPSCSVLPSLLAAPVMTRLPALITETPYWVYGAFSTPSHNPASGSEPACVSIHTNCTLVNTGFTTFYLCGNSFLQS